MDASITGLALDVLQRQTLQMTEAAKTDNLSTQYHLRHVEGKCQARRSKSQQARGNNKIACSGHGDTAHKRCHWETIRTYKSK